MHHANDIESHQFELLSRDPLRGSAYFVAGRCLFKTGLENVLSSEKMQSGLVSDAKIFIFRT